MGLIVTDIHFRAPSILGFHVTILMDVGPMTNIKRHVQFWLSYTIWMWNYISHIPISAKKLNVVPFGVNLRCDRQYTENTSLISRRMITIFNVTVTAFTLSEILYDSRLLIPLPYSSQNLEVFPWSRRLPTYVITIPHRYGRKTCYSNTTLCVA